MKRTYLAWIMAVVTAFGVTAISNVKAEGQDNNGKIPDQYIVVFKDGVNPDVATDDIVKNQGIGHLFTYKNALKGFAATIPQNKLDKIKNDSRVAYISEDRIVTADGKPSGKITQPVEIFPTGISRIGASEISNKGENVVVAVLDTGIDLTHPDLIGNIISGSGKSCISRTTTNDDNGHGTHVAGTIAASDNAIGVVGVASLAKLIPVKVLDKRGSGSLSSVICGIDWITANAVTSNIKVANMSLGGGGSSDNNCGIDNNDAMHAAICKSRDAGVTYVVAAGNEGADTLNSIPASYDDAVITVSALADSDGLPGDDDVFASFSNYGAAVDLGAPGLNIRSTWKGGGYNTISGTSMATPHVSGAVALFLAKNTETVFNGETFKVVQEGLKTAGELLGAGHSDISGKHDEPVVNVSSFDSLL